MKKVLLAVDATEGSWSVLSVIKTMSKPECAVLVHVTRRRAAAGPRQQAPAEESQKILDFFRKELENAGIANVKTVAREGNPSEEILKVAAREEADLVIIGRNRKSGLHRFETVSVSKEVEQHATLPVLVARTGGRKKSIAYDWRGEVYAAH